MARCCFIRKEQNIACVQKRKSYKNKQLSILQLISFCSVLFRIVQIWFKIKTTNPWKHWSFEYNRSTIWELSIWVRYEYNMSTIWEISIWVRYEYNMSTIWEISIWVRYGNYRYEYDMSTIWVRYGKYRYEYEMSKYRCTLKKIYTHSPACATIM